MQRKFGCRAVTPCVAALCVVAAGWGQQAAVGPGVSVVIADPSGAGIANAPVRVLPEQTTDGQPLRTVRTDATGRVQLQLPAGNYVLEAEAPGFGTMQHAVTVRDGAPRAEVVLTLTVTAAAEVVQVQAEDGDAEAGSGESLVLKGNTLNTLSDNPTTLQQQLTALVGSEDGSPPQFRIDGFSGGRFPPKSSIREVRVNQNGYSSQFDQRGNTVIDVFTKPGSDTLHGVLFANGNADTLNARNPYITAQPAYHTTYLEGNLNGPLGRKTSFFVGGNRNDMENNAAVNAVVLDGGLNPAALAQAVPNPSVTNAVSLRLDRQLPTNNTFTGRYEFADSHLLNSGVGQLALASEGSTVETQTNTLQMGNTTVVGAKTVVETRFQYLRTRTRQTPDSTAPTLVVQGSFNGGGSPGQSSEDKLDNYEFQEYMSFDRGKHFIRAGGRYRLTRDSNFSTANYNGQYIFPTLAAYQSTLRGQAAGQTAAQIRAAGGGASQFNLTAGSPSAAVVTGDLGVYVEDEWKVRPHFSLIPGLRYETQSAVPDHDDPAPRLAFTWGVYRGKAKSPLLTLRGGAGVFYGRFAAADILNSVRQNGVMQGSYYVQNPDFYPAVPTPAGLSSVPPTVYRLAPDLRTSYYVTEGITASRALGGRGNVSFTFNNIHGVHLYLSRNVNAPLDGVPGGVRPLGGTQNVYQYSSNGTLNARSLFTNYNLQLGKHAGLWGSYIVQFRQSDTGGAESFVSNSYDVHADYGRPAGLARQRVYTGGWWDVGKGFSGSMFLAAHTATRFNITTGADNNGDSIYNDRPAFATDLSRASVVKTAFGNFDTAPVGGQQIIPVNYGRAPGLFSLQVQVGKGFSFGPLPKPEPVSADAAKAAGPAEKPERPYKLYFSVESQNVLNTVNPGQPVGQLSSPYFGRSLTLNTEQTGSTAANRQVSFFGQFRF